MYEYSQSKLVLSCALSALDARNSLFTLFDVDNSHAERQAHLARFTKSDGIPIHC